MSYYPYHKTYFIAVMALVSLFVVPVLGNARAALYTDMAWWEVNELPNIGYEYGFGKRYSTSVLLVGAPNLISTYSAGYGVVSSLRVFSNSQLRGWYVGAQALWLGLKSESKSCFYCAARKNYQNEFGIGGELGYQFALTDKIKLALGYGLVTKGSAGLELSSFIQLGYLFDTEISSGDTNFPKISDRKMPKTWSAVWRSLLVPGWGQYHRGDKKMGTVYLGGFLVSASGEIYFRRLLDTNRRRYLEAQTSKDEKHYLNAMRRDDSIRMVFSSGVPSFYFASLLDAIFFTRWFKGAYGRNERPEIVSLIPGVDGKWGLSLRMPL